MKSVTSTPPVVRSNKPSPETPPSSTSDTTTNEAEKELAWTLNRYINKNGRYTYELDRYALAFAAGRGGNTREYQAKQEIEKIFTREVGVPMHQVLEKYREERGLKNEPMRNHR